MRIETGGTIKKGGTCFIATVDGETFKHSMPDGTTLNVVELTAIKFASLGSNEAATITTRNQYIADLLKRVDDTWCKDPKSNVELVDEIRSIIIEKGSTVEFDRESEIRNLCK